MEKNEKIVLTILIDLKEVNEFVITKLKKDVTIYPLKEILEELEKT
ncbi:hypothetical protein [Spiroplasma endosymbiont of Diplazon laetatorius]